MLMRFWVGSFLFGHGSKIGAAYERHSGLKSRCVRAGRFGISLKLYIVLFPHMHSPRGRSGRNGMALLDIPSRPRPTSFLVLYMLVLPFTWTITNLGGFSERGWAAT